MFHLAMATDNDQVGDHPDDVESVEEEENQKDINKLLNFHDVFTALKNQNLADTMASLPPDVRRRINALKKIQLDSTKIEAQFFKEVHELECKYIQQYVPLYKTREAIVTGAYEPTDDECKWALDEEEELSKDLKEKAVVADVKKEEVPAPVKGIPDFWLTVFRNVNLLADMLQEHDEPILKHLIDIKTHLTNEPMVSKYNIYISIYTLHFHYASVLSLLPPIMYIFFAGLHSRIHLRT